MRQAVLILLASAPGCVPSQERAQRVVHAWLLCEECNAGELDSVRALGHRAVDPLRAALLAGPSPQARANLSAELRASYQSDSSFLTRRNLAVPGSRDDYVRHFLDNLVALYQVRAAHGLGRIGGTAARDALLAGADSASLGRYRSDVGAAIQFARDSLWAP